MLKQQEQHTKQLKGFKAEGPIATIFGSVNTGSWRLERPVVDFTACVKCGTCQRYCPVDAITIDKDQAECIQFDWEFCKGCGICANECPKQCIRMVEEGGKA